MGCILGGMACSVVPPLCLCAALCIHLCCVRTPRPAFPFQTLLPTPSVCDPQASLSLHGQVFWAAELLQFPLLLRNEGTIELLGWSDDL